MAHVAAADYRGELRAWAISQGLAIVPPAHEEADAAGMPRLAFSAGFRCEPDHLEKHVSRQEEY
jgi:hypothetical protein